MQPSINNISCRDILMWRIGSALFWSIIMQALFLIMFLFVINFNPWHPILWIQQSAIKSVSLGTWLYLCPLALVICGQGLVCCKDFITGSRLCGTRFSIFYNMFSLRNLTVLFFCTIIGGFITWTYISLLGGKYGTLIVECTTDGKKSCLIEGCLFLILNGFWIGIYFFVHDYISGPKILLFPTVHQLKFLQVKTELYPLLKQAMVDAVSPTMYFVVIYYLNGGTIREYVGYASGYIIEDKPLETIFGLLNFPLLFYSWFFSGVFIFTIYTMKLLSQVALTEHAIFPITPAVGYSKCVTLHQALFMIDIPIIQYLGFLDLKILAEKDKIRREELFALSQPGGHPYNWNAVVEECLKHIRRFTEDLNVSNMETQSSLESKEHTMQYYFPQRSSANVSTVGQHASFSGMRNMSLRVENMSNISFYQSPSNIVHLQSPSNISQFQPPPIEISQESILRMLKLHFTQAVHALCKKPGFSFIFGELPDVKVRYHLSQGQPVIWTVQGLSCLAAASFKEDCYGVVQKDLPAIITSLLQLKQTLDKLQKLGNYKKSLKTEHHDIKMKAALRSAVKRSLYSICITFGDCVKELPLTKEILQQLQNFLLFREG